MKINGANGANTQLGQMGMNQETDSYSRNIQNQIADAQKQLQELSSNEEMTLEEKMKKRQEIQRQISDLNMQLRQHQAEQRKEKRQAKGPSMDDMLGGAGNTGSAKAGSKNTGLSKAGMTAMISADTSIKQAKAQGGVAAGMKGRAGVLEAEIKQDAGRGADVEKKKEELADVTQKAENATASQMNTLTEANKAMKKAATAERSDNQTAAQKNSKVENGKAKSTAGYTKELEKLVPSVEFRIGNAGVSAQSGKTLTVNPKLLEKMQNDPKTKKDMEDMIKGVESMTKLAESFTKASGWTTVYRHSYIDENGKYHCIAQTRNDGMLKLSDELREERKKNSKELLEKSKEKAAEKREELQEAARKNAGAVQAQGGFDVRV